MADFRGNVLGEYGVKANVKGGHRFLRKGALCWITNPNWGWGSERVFIHAMSRSGRMVETWIAAKELTNFRVGWIPPNIKNAVGYFTSWDKDKGSIYADSMNKRFGGVTMCNEKKDYKQMYDELLHETLLLRSRELESFTVLEECGLSREQLGTVAKGISILVKRHGKAEFELNKQINMLTENAERKRNTDNGS